MSWLFFWTCNHHAKVVGTSSYKIGMPLWPDLKLHPNLMDLLISHNFRQEALSWPSSITYTIKYVFSFHVFSPCYNTNSWSCISYWLCSQSQLWLSFAYPFLSSKLSLRDESWKRFRQIFGSDDGGMCTKDSILFLSFWDLYYTLLQF